MKTKLVFLSILIVFLVSSCRNNPDMGMPQVVQQKPYSISKEKNTIDIKYEGDKYNIIGKMEKANGDSTVILLLRGTEITFMSDNGNFGTLKLDSDINISNPSRGEMMRFKYDAIDSYIYWDMDSNTLERTSNMENRHHKSCSVVLNSITNDIPEFIKIAKNVKQKI